MLNDIRSLLIHTDQKEGCDGKKETDGVKANKWFRKIPFFSCWGLTMPENVNILSYTQASAVILLDCVLSIKD